MNKSSILVEKTEGRTMLLLNRPEVMNAIHTPMHFELEEALNDFAADATQRICVIKGAGGRAFCAGTDLKFAARKIAEGRGEELTFPPHGYGGLVDRHDLAKPIVAAVDGIAYGGGFELALACDLIIATDRSRFALPEPRVGAVAIAGGLHRLARQVGLKQAMAVVLSAEPVSAQEGLRLGFLNEVVGPDALDAAVLRWTSLILQNAPAAIAASKSALMRGLDEPSLAQAIRAQWSYAEIEAWLASKEFWEGANAFADKRTPSWALRMSR